jgi:hypothetical protein
MKADGIDSYWMTDGWITDDPTLASALNAWGLSAATWNGSITTTILADTSANQAGTSGSSGAPVGVSLKWAAVGSTVNSPAQHLRMFVVDGGYLPYHLLGAMDMNRSTAIELRGGITEYEPNDAMQIPPSGAMPGIGFARTSFALTLANAPIPALH